jgi:hypothetical protein
VVGAVDVPSVRVLGGRRGVRRDGSDLDVVVQHVGGLVDKAVGGQSCSPSMVRKTWGPRVVQTTTRQSKIDQGGRHLCNDRHSTHLLQNGELMTLRSSITISLALPTQSGMGLANDLDDPPATPLSLFCAKYCHQAGLVSLMARCSYGGGRTEAIGIDRTSSMEGDALTAEEPVGSGILL